MQQGLTTLTYPPHSRGTLSGNAALSGVTCIAEGPPRDPPVRAGAWREPGSPRLLDRVRDAIRTRHYSPRTEQAYVAWIRRFVLFHGKRHPLEMGAPEVSQYLNALATRGHVSASTQNQSLSALLFLYGEVLGTDLHWVDGIVRPRRPARLPVVLSREEVAAILERLHGVPWIMASLLYGAGLRLMECARLRVKDVDFARNEITVRQGKGAKDRVTLLPAKLKGPLAAHLERVRKQHECDLARECGSVEMPDALGRKYPNGAREWGWQWLLPATRFYADAATGERRRHHLHESVLQLFVKGASLVRRPAAGENGGDGDRRGVHLPERATAFMGIGWERKQRTHPAYPHNASLDNWGTASCHVSQ